MRLTPHQTTVLRHLANGATTQHDRDAFGGPLDRLLIYNASGERVGTCSHATARSLARRDLATVTHPNVQGTRLTITEAGRAALEGKRS